MALVFVACEMMTLKNDNCAHGGRDFAGHSRRTWFQGEHRGELFRSRKTRSPGYFKSRISSCAFQVALGVPVTDMYIREVKSRRGKAIPPPTAGINDAC